MDGFESRGLLQGRHDLFWKRVFNPLLNPVSDIHEWKVLMTKDTKPLMTDHHQPLPQAYSYQWTTLKAEEDNGKENIETGSYQPFLEKGFNTLLNPVSDIHEWRALKAFDSKTFMSDHQQPPPKAHRHNHNSSFGEFHEEIAVDSRLSCWLSSSSEIQLLNSAHFH